MNKSESIGKLAEALAKAQSIMKPSPRSEVNPFFKSRYSDLASVWDACREPLTDNGLSVTQLLGTDDNGRVQVETMLMHSSGEWLSSVFTLQPMKEDPQAMGSAVTYGRRYALSAIVGVAPDDDDGNAASAKTDAKPDQNYRPSLSAVRVAADIAARKSAPESAPEGPKSVDELNQALADEYNVSSNAVLVGLGRLTKGEVKDIPSLEKYGLLKAYRLFRTEMEKTKAPGWPAVEAAGVKEKV